jgi:hypothetical protein
VNDFEIVAGVFVAVFILGIGAGVVIVIALSALRQRRGIPPDARSPGRPGPRRDEIDLGREEKRGPTDDPRPPRWPRDGGYQG